MWEKIGDRIIHHHHWTLRFELYAPPPALKSLKTDRITEDMWDRCLFGTTTFLYECDGCGEPRRVVCPGNKKEAQADGLGAGEE